MCDALDGDRHRVAARVAHERCGERSSKGIVNCSGAEAPAAGAPTAQAQTAASSTRACASLLLVSKGSPVRAGRSTGTLRPGRAAGTGGNPRLARRPPSILRWPASPRYGERRIRWRPRAGRSRRGRRLSRGRLARATAAAADLERSSAPLEAAVLLAEGSWYAKLAHGAAAHSRSRARRPTSPETPRATRPRSSTHGSAMRSSGTAGTRKRSVSGCGRRPARRRPIPHALHADGRAPAGRPPPQTGIGIPAARAREAGDREALRDALTFQALAEIHLGLLREARHRPSTSRRRWGAARAATDSRRSACSRGSRPSSPTSRRAARDSTRRPGSPQHWA